MSHSPFSEPRHQHLQVHPSHVLHNRQHLVGAQVLHKDQLELFFCVRNVWGRGGGVRPPRQRVTYCAASKTTYPLSTHRRRRHGLSIYEILPSSRQGSGMSPFIIYFSEKRLSKVSRWVSRDGYGTAIWHLGTGWQCHCQ